MDLLSPTERLALRRIANESTDTKAKIRDLHTQDLVVLERVAFEVYIEVRDEHAKRKMTQQRNREAAKEARERAAVAEPGADT